MRRTPSLLDAARQLLADENEPTIPLRVGGLEHVAFLAAQKSVTGLMYLYCHGNAPMADGHMPGCMWPRRGEVLAALERAEQSGSER